MAPSLRSLSSVMASKDKKTKGKPRETPVVGTGSKGTDVHPKKAKKMAEKRKLTEGVLKGEGLDDGQLI